MEEIPQELLKEIRFVFAENVQQVFREALKEKTPRQIAASAREMKQPRAAAPAQ